jgi:GT2 family glycosyltransferase
VVLAGSDRVRGCSRAWNDALAASTGDPVVLAADDLVFQPGWLDAALEEMERFDGGWGLVGFNDGHFGEELSTHYMVSKRLIREHFGGVIAWECYHHSFNDREANERAKRAGRYVWCRDARVHHSHWLFGDRLQDATDLRHLPRHPESEATFSARMAAGFPNNFDPAIT